MNNNAFPNSFPSSSKKIRSQRKEFTTACSACFKREKDLGQSLRRCAKCHQAFYCSRECQALNWPSHKRTCEETGVSKLVPKLVKTMLSDQNMLVQLQACFILAFDLHQRARCDEMLIGRVDISVEPGNMDDFSNIFLGEGSSKSAIQGMLQVNAFTPVEKSGKSRFFAERRVLWHEERAKADSAGFSNDPVIIINNSLANRFWNEKRGANVDFRRCINMHIRADTKNKLLLRTEMRPSDIQIIRNAAKNSQTVPAMILHAKIAREYIYQSLYQKFLKRRKAATGVTPSIPQVHLSPR
ncbi:hypothetical protein C8R45DRAFT_931297 [Mycena sanguinolenta]|nr:hypothetical protein C8R45DRAFT_931297 [Mycena sanguinolenta]